MIFTTADGVMATSPYVALICGLVTLAVTMLSSTYGKKALKLIPFIMGILAGYAVAAIFTVIGNSTGMESLCVIDFSIFANMGGFFELPPFTFVTAKEGLSQIDAAYIGTVAVAYVPVAFVVFAEHIADHKNLSSIIEKDLLEDPGLAPHFAR